MGVGHNDSLKVYVRLPIKIKEEFQIKDLHPDIQDIQLPRQKSRRWCIITFPDQETLKKVVAHLKTLKIDNKKIVVKPVKRREPRQTERLLLSIGHGEAVDNRLQLLAKDDN